MHIPIKFYRTCNNKNLRLVAFVGIDPCVFPLALRYGDALNGIPVENHPYLMAWRFSVSQTRKMAAMRIMPATEWMVLTAQAVCKMHDWEWEVPVKKEPPKKRGRYNVKPRQESRPRLDSLTGKPYVSKAAKPKL